MTKTNQQEGKMRKITDLKKSYNKQLVQLEPLLYMFNEYVIYLSRNTSMWGDEARHEASLGGFISWLEALKDDTDN